MPSKNFQDKMMRATAPFANTAGGFMAVHRICDEEIERLDSQMEKSKDFLQIDTLSRQIQLLKSVDFKNKLNRLGGSLDFNYPFDTRNKLN